MHCLSFGVSCFASLGYFLVVGGFFLHLIFKLFGAETMPIIRLAKVMKPFFHFDLFQRQQVPIIENYSLVTRVKQLVGDSSGGEERILEEKS